jgi:hypothetical protein
MSKLYHGDCLAVLRDMPSESVHAIVTDPPYGLRFLGKHWDYQLPDGAIWQECLRVLKPGGYMLAFGGTRTFHRLAVSIEDAEFEVRDTLMFLYATGFPKSADVSKVIDKAAGRKRETVRCRSGGKLAVAPGQANDRSRVVLDITAPAAPESARWQGWGTALKPSYEPITLARKPLIGPIAANVSKHGVGALNIDACRIATADDVCDTRHSEPWRMNAKASGTLVTQTKGRWPANTLHDGSPEVLEAFAAFGTSKSPSKPISPWGRSGFNPGQAYSGRERDTFGGGYGDSGTPARFYFCGKASKADRCGSRHPTVKPLALMRWLCRLICPPGGMVLDPFAGSGTTGEAALLEGFDCILIEREAEYIADIRRRLRRVYGCAGSSDTPNAPLPSTLGR